MSCKFLIAITYDYIRNTCLWLFSTRMLYHYLSTIADVIDYYMNYLVHATPVHPSLCLQYLILLFTIDIVTVSTLLSLLLFYYCYHYKTIDTDKPLRASLFLGAAELTTHLLRLINILWLPLCRINKFRFYFPRRLLRSHILVGHYPARTPRSLCRELPLDLPRLHPSPRRPCPVCRRRFFSHELRALHDVVVGGDRNRVSILSPLVGVGSWWSSPAPTGSGETDLQSISTNQRDLVRHGLAFPCFFYSMLYTLLLFVTNV
jgi:hypothetical protein